VNREGWVVRRLGPADRDLAKIVEQINGASMEIGEPFTQDSLEEFLADDRNIYLTEHSGGQFGWDVAQDRVPPSCWSALRVRG
jgi:hypothetical protein